MSILDNIIANDCAIATCDTVGGFAEPVPYTPHIDGVAQTMVTVNAVVDRHPPEQMEGTGARKLIKKATLFIPRDSATGLVNRPNRGDLFTLSWQEGDPPSPFRVTDLPQQNDPGGWYVVGTLSNA